MKSCNCRPLTMFSQLLLSSIEPQANTPRNKILFRALFAVCSFFMLLTPTFAQSLLDPAFDTDGKVTAQYQALNSKGFDSVLQPDGKIVVAGSANPDSGFPANFQISVMRFNTDGSLDSTFDGDGKAIVTPSAGSTSRAISAALQTDGKIIVAGQIGEWGDNNSPKPVIIRFNANGTLDTTFDGDGIKFAVFDTQVNFGNISDIIVQPDGKIVVGSGYLGMSFLGFVIARFNSDGALDTTFGTGGYTKTPTGSSTIPTARIARTADGKFLLTGISAGAKLVRYNADGLPDSSFGGNGIISNAGGDAVYVDSNGKIVALDNSSQVSTVVRRYNSDGSADTSFGTNGAVSFSYTNANGNINPPGDLAFQTDGKILIGGSVGLNSGSRDFALTRLNANGTFDLSFGSNGQVTTDIQGDDVAHSILIQTDGKIVLTGESAGGFSLTRYTPGAINNACRPLSDFDGDTKSDLAIFKPTGEWTSLLSSTGSGGGIIPWGLSTDLIVPSDYNGDCRTDFAVFRNGNWYIRNSGANPTFLYYNFGQNGDIPVPADFDGDDLADAAVFRNGNWYIQRTRDGFYGVQFGLATDKPVTGDFDGDGKEDLGVYRDGFWYLLQSDLGFGAVQFGTAGDKPVVGDYDGDGKSDVAVFRPSNGTWYLLRSTQGFAAQAWGISTDLPVPADFDGDGKTDIAVYRNGNWFILRSTSGFQAVLFGTSADRPVQNAFIP